MMKKKTKKTNLKLKPFKSAKEAVIKELYIPIAFRKKVDKSNISIDNSSNQD